MYVNQAKAVAEWLDIKNRPGCASNGEEWRGDWQSQFDF